MWQFRIVQITKNQNPTFLKTDVIFAADLKNQPLQKTSSCRIYSHPKVYLKDIRIK
jgi:hypothetical protein